MSSIEEQLEIPAISSLEDFRRWALSDEFPKRGRIDYIGGRIEVDMSPEDLFTHGNLKGEIYGVLWTRVKRQRSGVVFVDSSRLSSPSANLSVEPDVVYISRRAVDSGRVRLIPKASRQPGRYVEIEGAADLTVEIVSDSSVTKDMQRLPEAYFHAGVREFWLVDARGPELAFQIYHRGSDQFESTEADADGFQRSTVFPCAYRLDRGQDPVGLWEYDLREKSLD